MIILDRYRTPADLPEQLPVFPLRGAILLPRATLPLNVFEPRYVAMLDEVISGNRLVGIIQPDRNTQVDDEDELIESGDVALRKVGCVGRVTAFQELEDERLIITLTGVSRFANMSEQEVTTPYRRSAVDFAPYAGDLQEGLGEEDVDRETLLRVLKTYLETRNLEADWRSIMKSSTEFLVNSLSVVAPYGPEEKQALLEAADLKTRAEILVALAEMELVGGDGSSGSGSTLQ